MPSQTFLQRLSTRLIRRSSASPTGGPEFGQGTDRIRQVRGKVELQGRLLVEGIARLSVSEDHSWWASWSSDQPWPDWMQSRDPSVSLPSCTVRFEGITPAIEGVISEQSSLKKERFGLKVAGDNWPATDFE
jgi:hypothetical protein